MKFTIKIFFCLICLSCALDSVAGDKNSLLIRSEPDGAGVFHYLRGSYYFLGYTPLQVSRDDLEGKTDTRILLLKYGYKRNLVDVHLEDKSGEYRLKAEDQPYLHTGEDCSSNSLKCRTKIAETIHRIVKQRNKFQMDFKLPFRWAEDRGKRKLVVLVDILDHDNIAAIRKAESRDKEEALEAIRNLINPAFKPILEEFARVECLEYLFLVVTYAKKALQVDFTPYQSYWTATSYYDVGNTRYTTIAWGSTVELNQDMVLINNNKTYLFEYKLH
jgi:hypothetical protein